MLFRTRPCQPSKPWSLSLDQHINCWSNAAFQTKLEVWILEILPPALYPIEDCFSWTRHQWFFSQKWGMIDLNDFVSQMSNFKRHSIGYFQGFGAIPSTGLSGIHHKLFSPAAWWDKQNIPECARQHLKLWRGNTWWLSAPWSSSNCFPAMYLWLALGENQHWLSD